MYWRGDDSMKKRVLLILAVFFLIGCPLHTEAASKGKTKVDFTIDAQETENPVSVKPAAGIGVSSSLSSYGVSTSMGTSKQVKVLYKALKSYKTSVNVKGYKITQKNLNSILTKAINKDYYLLDSIVTLKDGYGYIDNRTGYFTSIHFKYYYSKKTMKKRYSTLKSSITKIKKSLGTNLTKEQAALAAHDYLIKRATYDMSYYNKASTNPNYGVQWNSHTAYGILINKKGVCSGYAYAYRMLMKAYNIPCIIVDSPSMNHAWNMIELNNKWYHVDCTWDDPDASSSWTKNGSGTLVYYDYFLLNNSEMKNAHHYGWSPTKTSNSKVYSNMPRYSSEYQMHIGSYWYLIYLDDSHNYVYERVNLKGKNATTLRTSTSPLVFYNNRYYYVSNGTSIHSMNMDGTLDRDLTSLTGLPTGTTYVLKGMSNNCLSMTYTLPDHTTGSKSVAISSYEQSTGKLNASAKTALKVSLQ
jgi:hypothetical protein